MTDSELVRWSHTERGFLIALCERVQPGSAQRILRDFLQQPFLMAGNPVPKKFLTIKINRVELLKAYGLDKMARAEINKIALVSFDGQLPPCGECRGAMARIASQTGYRMRYYYDSYRWAKIEGKLQYGRFRGVFKAARPKSYEIVQDIKRVAALREAGEFEEAASLQSKITQRIASESRIRTGGKQLKNSLQRYSKLLESGNTGEAEQLEKQLTRGVAYFAEDIAQKAARPAGETAGHLAQVARVGAKAWPILKQGFVKGVMKGEIRPYSWMDWVNMDEIWRASLGIKEPPPSA